ncbi:MAG: 50S ribosomal protein L32 [Candidatus Latescibacterota bacterium]|nr:MAG: 50S ribosomal protein L32 [Candidatus Latescibacterota bacterium]RKY65391.1 MAG: 50S ribosomal protein L32 [Candidatus Latescibacterota bacterium]RKY65947.1 MAG: 50S ribosomal protein L32 [Candidatus Latescibacterota bacterium]RKY74774.1 MAG: 50S ribosomal protein L32 [Candidatus Latescibacterota bacterium]HDI00189.1 50S ribosomal protein L32 [Bacillota bacterium]
MALPKRKHSRSRRDKRRANWKAKAPTVVSCKHCGQPRLAHSACPNCGYYGNRQVVIPKEK